MMNKRREFSDLGRVLCGHQWRELKEWVGAIKELAELSDEEIAQIERQVTRAVKDVAQVAGNQRRCQTPRG